MRSHPLLVKLGHGTSPSMRSFADVKMYELDEGFAGVQHEFGADLYKAADWRWKQGSSCICTTTILHATLAV